MINPKSLSEYPAYVKGLKNEQLVDFRSQITNDLNGLPMFGRGQRTRDEKTLLKWILELCENELTARWTGEIEGMETTRRRDVLDRAILDAGKL